MTVAADEEIEQLRRRIAACPAGRRLLPVAGATKPAASVSARDDVDALDLSALSGIVEYDPAELTVTALAGTPVAQVADELARHDQYLPFDPPLAAAGATLGGVVASATSGSGALRSGGVRDFVIGVRLIDGTGQLVAGGGRVVKNAAGFDLPKLLVGSRGRLGVIVSLSFKIFPRPRASRTLELVCPDAASAVAMVRRLAAGPRELAAADVIGPAADEREGVRVLLRLSGEEQALSERIAQLIAAAGREHGAVRGGADEVALWDDAAALGWVPDGALVARVPLTAHQAPALIERLAAVGASSRVINAANLAWVAWPGDRDTTALGALLAAIGLIGVPLWGPPDTPPLGAAASGGAFAARVRSALDPHDRFLEL